eukprot:649684-Pyramimonas_sp.AAC.1
MPFLSSDTRRYPLLLPQLQSLPSAVTKSHQLFSALPITRPPPGIGRGGPRVAGTATMVSASAHIFD